MFKEFFRKRRLKKQRKLLLQELTRKGYEHQYFERDSSHLFKILQKYGWYIGRRVDYQKNGSLLYTLDYNSKETMGFIQRVGVEQYDAPWEKFAIFRYERWQRFKSARKDHSIHNNYKKLVPIFVESDDGQRLIQPLFDSYDEALGYLVQYAKDDNLTNAVVTLRLQEAGK